MVMSVFVMTSSASSKTEVITNKTASTLTKTAIKKNKVTEKECKQYLGVENYNFLNDVYSDKNVVISKCEEELKK